MSSSEVSNYKRDLVIGVLFALFATLGWSVVATDKANVSGYSIPGDPGPFLFPMICLSVVFFISLTVLISYFVSFTERKKFEDFILTDLMKYCRRSVLPIFFLTCVFLMPILMQSIGTFGSVFVFSSLFFIILGNKNSKGGILALVYGLISSLFFVGVFSYLLNVPLP